MVLIFYECYRNSWQAAQLYTERYPGRFQLVHNYFLRLENEIRTYGSFRSSGHRSPKVEIEGIAEIEIQVLAYLQINPRSSIRHVARKVGINPHKVHFKYQNNLIHSYKPDLIHHLRAGDRILYSPVFSLVRRIVLIFFFQIK